ncbi:hypothetical protein CLV93_104254 [Prolixibacter denitrificans]|uniref:Uncharacterized protein n=1 Tax=Prolixibacter denitrificans TaxID=1541063 RepID=A0A2P8CEB2_9BACT|nr:hypothetical protein CLV93_104254 [Prolixibacter denitrificans]
MAGSLTVSRQITSFLTTEDNKTTSKNKPSPERQFVPGDGIFFALNLTVPGSPNYKAHLFPIKANFP